MRRREIDVRTTEPIAPIVKMKGVKVCNNLRKSYLLDRLSGSILKKLFAFLHTSYSVIICNATTERILTDKIVNKLMSSIAKCARTATSTLNAV